MPTQIVNTDGMESFNSDTLFILTGDNTKFVLWKGGENSVFAMGSNQTIQEEFASPNIVYDFGKNLNLTFTPEATPEPAMTVYDFAQDHGGHITLSDGLQQNATETPYSQGRYTWGTKVTITSGAIPTAAPNVAFFAYASHVDIVHGA